MKGARLVRAGKLPASFAILTLWPAPIRCLASRVGRRVRVTLLDQEHGGATVIYLRLSQRVRILKGS